MSDPAENGIKITKDYYKDFLPTDLQWDVTSVSDDFTLLDLFKLVYFANKIIPNIAATFGMSNFDAFWNQINLKRDADDKDDIAYLELYWGLDYETRITQKTGKPTDQSSDGILKGDKNNYWDNPQIGTMPNLMSFGGTGPGCSMKNESFHECDDDCPKTTAYGVEFTPLNNLSHLPIRIATKVEFFPPFVEKDRDFHRTGFELTINPTLWSFITSIFFELTFGGQEPNEISEKWKDIKDRVDEVKKQLDKENE